VDFVVVVVVVVVVLVVDLDLVDLEKILPPWG
jgi:hypothetical protein